MKCCEQCGAKMMDEALICPHCGRAQELSLDKPYDFMSFGWGVLGFLIPLVGLILFYILKDSSPLKAKSVGIGALIGAVLYVIVYIILCVVVYLL